MTHKLAAVGQLFLATIPCLAISFAAFVDLVHVA